MVAEKDTAQDVIAPAVERGSVELTAQEAVKAVKAGRLKDVDIAAQIIAEYGHENEGWTAEEEKKLMRKVDWRLIPIVSQFPAGQLFTVLTK